MLQMKCQWSGLLFTYPRSQKIKSCKKSYSSSSMEPRIPEFLQLNFIECFCVVKHGKREALVALILLVYEQKVVC